MALFQTIDSRSGFNAGQGLVSTLKKIAVNFGLLEPAVTTSGAADYIPAINDRIILRSRATAQTLTIPANATVAHPIGSKIDVHQTGAGALTIVAAGGVTIRTPAGKSLALAGEYSVATLEKIGTNEWVASGDLAAANTSDVATAAYTLAAPDRVVRRSYAAAAQTTTVPPESVVNFPLGTTIRVEQASAQVNTIAAGAGVTVNVLATKTLATVGRYGVVQLTKVAADVWNASGDLAAA